MAEGVFEYKLVANVTDALKNVVKFTKEQEKSAQRIQKAIADQVKANVKLDQQIIKQRDQVNKARRDFKRFSTGKKQDAQLAAAAAASQEELTLELQEQRDELKRGKQAIDDYNRALRRMQTTAAKGFDIKGKPTTQYPRPIRPQAPGSPMMGPAFAGAAGFGGQVGRRAAFARGARNVGAQVGTAFTATSAAAGSSGLLAPLASGFALQQAIGGAVDLSSQRKKLEVLSKQYGEYDEILKIVKSSAENFNKSQREATTEFANVFARLRPLGVSLNEIKGVYEGFNAVAIASGATSNASRIAFMQLAQAIGSGRLAGDEFRSISEQIPGVLIPISEEMGVTVGELKNLGSEGKITSDILIRALSGSFAQNKDAIRALLKEQPAAKFKAFQNAVSDLADAVGNALLPVVLPIVEGLTELIELILRLPDPLKNATALAIGLGGAFFTLNAAATALNITLKGSLLVSLAAIAAKVALIMAPLIALGLVLDENATRQKEFEEAMASDDINVVDSKIKEIKTNIEGMDAALRQLKNQRYYKGQAENVRAVEQQLKKANEQLDALEGRKKLFIDVEFGIKNFSKGEELFPNFQERLTAELKKLGLKQNKNKPVSVSDEVIQQNKVEANNALRLAQRNADLKAKFARDEFALRLRLEQSQHKLEESNLIGIARQQLQLINARIAAARALEQRQRNLDAAVEKAEAKVKAATARRDNATGPVDRARASGNLDIANAELGSATTLANQFRANSDDIFQRQSDALTNKAVEGFRQQAEAARNNAQALKLRNRLLMEGVSDEVIQGELKKAEIDREASIRLQQLNEDRLGNAEAIAKIKDEVLAAKEAIDAFTDAQAKSAGAINQYIVSAQSFVNDIQGRIVDIAGTIESSIGQAISSVVSGTATASQAFQQFFASVGQSFIKMAAQIIAKLIIIKLLKTALGALFPSAPTGVSGGDLVTMGSSPAQASAIASGGAVEWTTDMPINAGNILSEFAKGGIVTNPTAALIGEGGMNEAVVPLPNGRAIPVDMGKSKMQQIQTSITVNVDQGGQAESDLSGDNANKLGLAINTAVKRVIIDERRAGGLLYNGRR